MEPELDLDAEPRTPLKRLGSSRKLAVLANVRAQLAEQTRALEARAEAAAGAAGELHEYCRRRADLEHEYARALDKLVRAAAARQRRREPAAAEEAPAVPAAAAAVCRAALEGARALARDHLALGDLYGGPLAARLQRAADDALRLHRKCRDIVTERQEEVSGAVREAGLAGKAAAAAASDWRLAALKLRRALLARRKLPADTAPGKKLRARDKDLDKRRVRYSEARARALRARADYAMSLEAANAALQRYYLDDIADIMMCTEVGFEAVVERAARAAADAEEAGAGAGGRAARALRAAAAALGARPPYHHQHPHPHPLRCRRRPPHEEDAEMLALIEGVDEAGEVDPEAAERRAAGAADPEAERAAEELRARVQQLTASARLLRAECRESAKTLDAAETALVRQMAGSDEHWDVSKLFGEAASAAAAVGAGAAPALPPLPDDAEPRRDQEDYYLAKFRAYASCAGRLARVEARVAAARRLCGAGEGGGEDGEEGEGAESPVGWGRRAGWGRGAPAALPADASLPRLVTSCVRVIAAHGLRHQGIFRVSGSQVEMQALRAAFARGEDPLAGRGRARGRADVHAVCGVLKQYLRSLAPPLVPARLLPALLAAAAGADGPASRRALAAALRRLPPPSLLLLRYLCAFLEYAAEAHAVTRMDAWNLAVCLGPSLLPAACPRTPHAHAALQHHAQANELVKRAILHHADLFPQELAPHARFVPPPPEEEDEEEEENDELDGDDPHHLALYDDDELSEDGDSGDWQDSNSTENSTQHSATSGRRAATQHPLHPQHPHPPAPQEAAAAAAAPAPVASSGRLAESTPDLVLDLPARAAAAAGPGPPDAGAGLPPDCAAPVLGPALDDDPAPAQDTAPALADDAASTLADSADTFLHNRDTLRKKPCARRSEAEESGAESEGGDGDGDGRGDGHGDGGSPVPARNTARVAAKFAELTLTGGSKPAAGAAKPAPPARPKLLRRPTPHPRPPTASAAVSAPAPAAAAADVSADPVLGPDHV